MSARTYWGREERLPLQQRFQALWKLTRPRHRRVIDLHWHDLLVPLQRALDLNVHEVLRIVEPVPAALVLTVSLLADLAPVTSTRAPRVS